MRYLLRNLLEIGAYTAVFSVPSWYLLDGQPSKVLSLAVTLGFFTGLLNDIRRAIRE